MANTIITVRVDQKSGNKTYDADSYKSKGKSCQDTNLPYVRVLRDTEVQWKCPDGDLEIQFTGDSPFVSKLDRFVAPKKQLTPSQTTRPLRSVRRCFPYTAKVTMPNGTVISDPDLEVDPGSGGRPKPAAKKSTAKRSAAKKPKKPKKNLRK
jgi:hypothetical protein